MEMEMEMETEIPCDDEFIFRSKLPDIHIPTHLPLRSYCFQNLSQFQHYPCLINGKTNDTFTYADVEQGHVIVLLHLNCPEFIFSFLGASHLRIIVTTANPFYTEDEVAKQDTASNTKLIITHASFVEKVKDFVNWCSSMKKTQPRHRRILSGLLISYVSPILSSLIFVPRKVSVIIHSKVQAYVMTEAGPAVSMSLAFAKEAYEVKSGACGTILRNAEMKIVDPEIGISLGRNQVDEICVRGKQIMKGETVYL